MDRGASPCRQDGVVDAGGASVVCGTARHDDAVGGEVLDDGLETVVVVDEDAAGDQPAAVVEVADVEASVGKRAHVGAVVVKVRKLSVLDGCGNAELGEQCGEGSEDSVLDKVGGGVPDGNRLDLEDLVVHQVNHHGTLIDHGGNHGVELGNDLVEDVRGGAGGKDVDLSTTDNGLRMDLDRHGGDYTEAGAASAQSPVQVAVLGSRSSKHSASSGDNLKLEGLIGAETKLGAESRVAAALGEASGDTNGWALARDGDESLGVGSLEDLKALDSGADLDGRAGVVLARIVQDADALQVMGPDAQGASTGRTAKEARWRERRLVDDAAKKTTK